MLNTVERRTVFWLFCAFATACVVAELFLIYAMVEKGFTNVKGAFAIGVLVSFGLSFAKLVDKTFLKPNYTLPERLHRLASDRCRIIENARRSRQDIYTTRRNLITNTLKFCEECLNGWVPGSHFELCVFVDRDQPLLLAYFDSHQDDTARSMAERARNPHFYVEQGYEVTRLLHRPTSLPPSFQIRTIRKLSTSSRRRNSANKSGQVF